MTITFSQSADMILSRHQEFREGLLKLLGERPAGHCFIDGRVGRTPGDDELVLRCQGQPAITIPYHEFGDAATLQRILEEWSGSGSS